MWFPEISEDAADSLPIYCGIVLPKTQLNINTSLGQTLL